MTYLSTTDRAELQRLASHGSIRAICDIEGRRGGIDLMGHIELATEGTLLFVTPMQPINIKDALSGKESR